MKSLVNMIKEHLVYKGVKYMYDITSKVWNAINSYVYEMQTLNSVTEGKCEYLMIDTDEYAKVMPRLSVRDNVMILCTSDQSFFTIMVPVFERTLSQREIDNIIMGTQDINKKVNLPSPIPYYVWFVDMSMFVSIEVKYPCILNSQKILSYIEMTDKCGKLVRNYLERTMGFY